jgi:hypothetical protein
MERDINETLQDFDEHHLADVEDFDLEMLSFFHELAVQIIDEYVFNQVDVSVDLEDYRFGQIYFHTNALVLKRIRLKGDRSCTLRTNRR